MPEAKSKKAASAAPNDETKQGEDSNTDGENKPKASRSKFDKLFPENARIKLLVDKNPKKAGSKSAERFEHYFGAETVGDFLAAGGTYGDIAYDLPRGFIEVEKVAEEAA